MQDNMENMQKPINMLNKEKSKSLTNCETDEEELAREICG